MKVLLKELESRLEYLKSVEQTQQTVGRIKECKLSMVRTQQLLLDKRLIDISMKKLTKKQLRVFENIRTGVEIITVGYAFIFLIQMGALALTGQCNFFDGFDSGLKIVISLCACSALLDHLVYKQSQL
jgi:UDP-N-acetylmuramyl pentapeptide phosphotransferase/UDP-N-acetylglucosamine-1-phosphate transferase